MTDNEIIKALECCIGGYGVRNCDDCSMQGKAGCIEVLPRIALDLINRQKAEIERLNAKIKAKDEINYYNMGQLKVARGGIKTAKSEAIKKFAEQLKKRFYLLGGSCDVDTLQIDNLVKQMTEVQHDT